jgi:hypothetical protein
LIILLNTSQYYKCTEKISSPLPFHYFSLFIFPVLSFLSTLCNPSLTRVINPLHAPLVGRLSYAPPSPTPANSVTSTSASSSFSTPYISHRFFICPAPSVSHQRTRASKLREELQGVWLHLHRKAPIIGFSGAFTVGAVLLTLSFGRASTEAVHRVVDEALPNAPLNNPYQSKSIFFTRSSSNL